MSKILIFGNGYLGNKLNNILGNSEISSLYVENYDDLIKELKNKNPEIVINCAGKTGKPNVDWCEFHKIETFASNVICPALLLKATQELGIFFVHLSSGCIYNGYGKKYTEEDVPNFEGSYYSKTKLIAEEMLRDFDILIIRLRMPLDSIPNKKNLITKLVNYKKIISLENSISVIPDALLAIKKLIELKKTGIYNVVNPGKITNKELLELYKEYVDPEHEYELINPDEANTILKAPRSNCLLNTDKLNKEGIQLPDVKDAVIRELKKYKK